MLSVYFSELIKLIFPTSCKICGKQNNNLLCESCLNQFQSLKNKRICDICGAMLESDEALPEDNAIDETPYNNQPFRQTRTESLIQQKTNKRCSQCQNKNIFFFKARSAGIYEGTLKEAIHILKYRNGKKLSYYLASFMNDIAKQLIDEVDVISYVPLTSYKESIRGYNQSFLIANEVSKIFNKPLKRTLKKIKDNAEQNKLGLAERQTNVSDAFKAIKPIYNNILLIDDVYTTGNTVNECSRVLKEAGTEKIFVLTLARTPLKTITTR